MDIIYLMGKSSTGKDTIFNCLKNQLDVKTYVPYTTRPKRKGEENGVDYNFILNEEMQEYINNKKENKLIESRTYQTVHGPWTYATILDSQFQKDKDLIMIGTLESYNKMVEFLSKRSDVNLLDIYIEVEDGLRLERAIKREQEQETPKYAELCRRFLSDSEDFSEENLEKAGIKTRFENIDLNKCIEEIKEYINTRKTENKEELKR